MLLAGMSLAAVAAIGVLSAGSALAGGDIFIQTPGTHRIPDGHGSAKVTTPVMGPGTINDMFVGVRVSHPQTRDLKLSLKGPDGTKSVLTNRDTKGQDLGDPGTGCEGNYTFFRDGVSGDDLSTGSAPYSDTFHPVHSLLDSYSGDAAAGNWTLIAKDLKHGNKGKLRCFTISFYVSP